MSQISYKSNVQNILGPISLTEHISKSEGFSNKHIYIFGDEHHFTEGCKNKDSLRIDHFLEKLLDDNQDKIIDIFLEVPYLSKDSKNVVYEYREEAGYLFKHLINTFTNCLQVLKNTCKYKNARFHYTDLRFMNLDSFINLQYLIEKIESIAKYIEDLWDGDLTRKEAKLCLEKIGKEIKKFNKYEFTFSFDEILNNTKINKQISHISDKNIKNILKQKLEGMKSNEQTVNDGVKLVNELNYLGTEEGKKEFLKGEDNFNELYDNIDKIHHRLMDFQSSFMDVFLLSRVFRSFKSSEDSKYIIIYAGNDHAKSYRDFFSSLNFKLVSESYDENQCLDISHFNKPFFKD